jgi:glycosyltransferase involved in cell wall biosynthesis
VTVFTLGHKGLNSQEDVGAFSVVRLKTPFIYGDGGAIPTLYKRLKGYDVIHLHYPFFGGAEYVYLASLLRRQPYFLTYHMDVKGNTLIKKMVMGAYEPLLTKKIIQKAKMVGALSLEHLKSSKAGPLVDWSRVVEMPNGVDPVRFRPGEKDKGLAGKYRLGGKTVVLFVGNLQPFKGLHILIEAVSGTSDKSIVLLVVGGGYDEAEYRKDVARRGLEDRVIFAGPRSHADELHHYYALGDFLVLPSTHSESFGLVVLEAMSSGIPAIVSSLPGPSQLIEDGVDGLIAKAGDAEDLRRKIEYLAEDKALRLTMGKAAREKVLNKYSWEKTGERLEAVLKEIVNGRSERRESIKS